MQKVIFPTYNGWRRFSLSRAKLAAREAILAILMKRKELSKVNAILRGREEDESKSRIDWFQGATCTLRRSESIFVVAVRAAV